MNKKTNLVFPTQFCLLTSNPPPLLRTPLPLTPGPFPKKGRKNHVMFWWQKRVKLGGLPRLDLLINGYIESSKQYT